MLHFILILAFVIWNLENIKNANKNNLFVKSIKSNKNINKRKVELYKRSLASFVISKPIHKPLFTFIRKDIAFHFNS